MVALGEHGLPVPYAVAHNRHCVLMTMVDAIPLVQVSLLLPALPDAAVVWLAFCASAMQWHTINILTTLINATPLEQVSLSLPVVPGVVLTDTPLLLLHLSVR